MKARFSLLLLVVILGAQGASAEEKRPLFRWEEPWSPECLPVVAETPRLGRGITMPGSLETPEPIESLKKWGLACPDVWPVFELLVDGEGNVRCVRILNYSMKKPPPGLYDEVRKGALRWRFRPATRDGKPLSVVFSYVIQHKCS